MVIDTFEEDRYSFTPLYHPLHKIAPNITKELSLGWFIFTNKEFTRIIEDFHKLTQIIFHNWRIADLDEKLKFDKTLPYQIEVISFEKWGDSF